MGETKVGVIGAGNMGTALANLLAGNGCSVVLWDFFPEVVREINQNRRNSRYLPNIPLDLRISATEDERDCVAEAELVIIAIPSPFIRQALLKVKDTISQTALIVNAAKGIDSLSQSPIHLVILETLNKHNHAILAGAAIANEFARSKPTRVVLASEGREPLERIAPLFQNSFFHVETSDDVMGAALGGICKNVYAILLGYAETAFGGGKNFEAALLVQSLREMAELGIAMGARRETIYGLAGLGDLVATGFSNESHNRKFGRLLGSGHSPAEIEHQLNLLPEGARNARAVCSWAREKGVHIKLGRFVQDVLDEKHPSLPSIV